MLRRPHRRLRVLPVNSLLPNMLTVLALCAGMTSMRYALQERWEAAVLAIAVAGVLDGLDGRIARLLHGTSRFGAELDSLSDFLAFGVAPALLLYLWCGHELGGLGWVAALAYATCCALRLARFNVALDDPNKPAWAALFFTGVAAPCAAGLAILPVLLSFELGGAFWRRPEFVAIWLAVVAFLMVSRIPTFSLKRVRVRRDLVLPVLLVVGLGAALLVSYPWVVLPAIGLAYLVSIPFSVRSQRRYAAATAAERPPAPAPAPDAEV